MEENEVKKRILKVHVFEEFSYERLKEVLDSITKLGFKISVIDNGNFVCEDSQKDGKVSG